MGHDLLKLPTRAYAADYVNCLICGKLTQTHLRCRYCGILIGKGHTHISAENSGLCFACDTWNARLFR